MRSRAITRARSPTSSRPRRADEALRIRREEQLPIYERLGDVRERAVTLGSIADILEARGEPDEALRILRDETLPVFERTRRRSCSRLDNGQNRRRARSAGRDPSEALRILREEVLPVFERLGDVRGRAMTLQKIALAQLPNRGRAGDATEEILSSLSEAFVIFEKLDEPQGIAFTGAPLSELLVAGRDRKRALTVLDKARAAFARIGHAEGLADCDDLGRQFEGDDA